MTVVTKETEDPKSLEETQDLLAKAQTQIKTLEQDLRRVQGWRDDELVSHQKIINDFKARGTVIAWKVFLESVFYLGWLALTFIIIFVPLFQALILRRDYHHLYGSCVGLVSGWMFYVIIRERPEFH